jgi:hypothetical protein
MDLPLTVQQRFFWDRPGGNDGLYAIGKEYFSAVFHPDFGQTVLENPALGAGTLFQWFPADWHLTPDASLHLGFRVEPLAFKHRGFFHEKFKLGVFVQETADQLSIRAGFRPDCLRRATVRDCWRTFAGSWSGKH